MEAQWRNGIAVEGAIEGMGRPGLRQREPGPGVFIQNLAGLVHKVCNRCDFVDKQRLGPSVHASQASCSATVGRELPEGKVSVL